MTKGQQTRWPGVRRCLWRDQEVRRHAERVALDMIRPVKEIGSSAIKKKLLIENREKRTFCDHPFPACQPLTTMILSAYPVFGSRCTVLLCIFRPKPPSSWGIFVRIEKCRDRRSFEALSRNLPTSVFAESQEAWLPSQAGTQTPEARQLNGQVFPRKKSCCHPMQMCLRGIFQTPSRHDNCCNETARSFDSCIPH